MPSIYAEEHHMFRDSFRAWVADRLAPRAAEFEKAGIVDREIFAEAGEHGYLGMAIDERFGGAGTKDFRFNAIIDEECAYAGLGGCGTGFGLHNDIVTPYFIEYCSEEQAERWLPGIAAGQLITAIAMTEPGTGSDLAAIATTAIKDGDEWVVNGSKTFITNGINSDLVVVVCRTRAEGRAKGLSLLVVERDMPGFERGRNLGKIGLNSSDTAELFFNDVRVPNANLLGEEGKAFEYLAFNLAQERLYVAVTGVAAAEAALEWTVDYVKQRNAFGKPIASFQNTKFVLAEISTEIEVTRPFVEQCIMELNEGKLSAAQAARAKLWGSELQNKVIDRCLQLFGGNGYTTDYPIGQAYVDARISPIYAGTNEIMKTIIAKDVLA
ncbi:MAG: acyl-CoA dehydrogenase family protein [Pseudomonadota bacterium]